MSRWATERKRRLARPPQQDVIDDLTMLVAWRICAAVYQKGKCDCKTRNRRQVCDQMRLAAQHAMSEIMS